MKKNINKLFMNTMNPKACTNICDIDLTLLEEETSKRVEEVNCKIVEEILNLVERKI
jgi:hypothetical protein